MRRTGMALTTIFVSLSLALGTPVQAEKWKTPVTTLKEALQTGRITQSTWERLNTTGRAPVIVQLNLPKGFQPEGHLTGTDLEHQRQVIQGMQEQIIMKLQDQEISHVKRFRTIPHLALHVDQPSLMKLVALSDVARVHDDRIASPLLDNSTLVIGGDRVHSAYGQAGRDQTVAIIDTGVDKTHPFFGDRVVSEACYSTESRSSNTTSLCPDGNDSSIDVDSGLNCPDFIVGCDHGTHVAGIAAGNGEARSGVANGANIIAIQAASLTNDADFCAPGGAPCPTIFDSDLMRGLERVYDLRNQFQIAAVNYSFGDPDFFYDVQSGCDEDYENVKDLIDNLRSVGIATIIASGNGAGGSNGDTFILGIVGPACISSAVSVGNTTILDQVAGSSQTAPFLDLLAPGTGILSSVPNNDFDIMSGTSMAAPHVTGAWAVLKSLDTSQSVDDNLATLQRTGIDVDDNRPGTTITTPRIQLNAAVEEVINAPLPPSEVRVSTVTGKTMVVEWVDNSDTEEFFQVIADSGAEYGTSTLEVPENGTQAQFQSLDIATRYEVRVKACREQMGANGNAEVVCSTSVEPVFQTTLDTRPSIPTLGVGTVTQTSIEVLWSVTSSNPITFFRIGTNANFRWPEWQVYTVSPGDIRSRTFGDLKPDRGYSFWIQACNEEACSNQSKNLHVGTLSLGIPIPSAPTDLQVLMAPCYWWSCPASGLQLEWRDRATNEDRFEIRWGTVPPGAPNWEASWSILGTVGADSYQYPIDIKLASGVVYYFSVKACNKAGCSQESNIVNSTEVGLETPTKPSLSTF